MTESIFTKIIKGDIPADKIYEDGHTLAFLDIYPIQPGHVLVVPKVEVDHIWDLPDDIYMAMWTTSKKVAQRLREVFPDKARVAVLVEGLEVAHAHIKLFPFNTDEGFRHKPDMEREPDHAALAELAKKLTF